MAAIFQPTYTTTLPDGRKITRHSPTWWIEYTDPRQGRRVRVKGYRDRMATEIKASDLERKAQRGDVGAQDPFEAMRKLPITAHLEAYKTHLGNKGVGGQHLHETTSHVQKAFKAAGAVRLDELKPLDAERFLQGLKEKGLGPKARNEYLSSIRTFYRWCIRVKRVSPEADPTVTIDKVPQAEDIRRERRALSLKELTRLLETALSRPLTTARQEGRLLSRQEVASLEREGMEHALVYKTAILTGIRRGELSRLTWADVDLNDFRPTIRVRASSAKSGKEDFQVVRGDLKADLLAWKALNPQAQDSDPVFQVPRRMDQLKADLTAAGIDYVDAQGRFFDFHSLRHCTATLLRQAKVDPRMSQAVMRHSDIRLTMQTYTDLQLMDKEAALDSLPDLPAIVPGGGKPQAQAVRATGTDGRPMPDSGALDYKGAYKRVSRIPQPVAADVVCMEAAPGFEPGDEGFADPCLTAWLCRPRGD